MNDNYDYVLALTPLGGVELYKVAEDETDYLLAELESEGKIFSVVRDEYIKDDMLCLNIYEFWKKDEHETD